MSARRTPSASDRCAPTPGRVGDEQPSFLDPCEERCASRWREVVLALARQDHRAAFGKPVERGRLLRRGRAVAEAREQHLGGEPRVAQRRRLRRARALARTRGRGSTRTMRSRAPAARTRRPCPRSRGARRSLRRRRRERLAAKVRGPAIAQVATSSARRRRPMGVRRDEPRIEQRAKVRAAVGREHRRRAPPALAFRVAASEVDAACMDERAERAAVEQAQRAA